MKKSLKIRLLSLTLVLCMVFSMLPVSVLAADASDVTVSGVSGTSIRVLDCDVPAGYRACCVYDITLPQGTASEVPVSIQADSSFDAALPVLVIHSQTGRTISTTIENGTVSFTMDASGTYALAQADVTSASGSAIFYTLSQVMSLEELESGVPYVIADYTKNWVLTNTATTVSGKTYPGLQLEGTPSADTSHLWYLDSEGYLVYGKSTATDYLLVGTDSNGDPYTKVGAVDSSNSDHRSAPGGSASGNADDLFIRNKAANGYLNRWGGGSADTVATRYHSIGGSYWHMFRRDLCQVTVTATPSMNDLPVSAVAQIFTGVNVSGSPASEYTIEWTSSNPAIATVRGDGLVMPTAPGQFIIIGTVTQVNGVTLSTPILLEIPMSSYVSRGTATEVTATGYTVPTSRLSTNLTAGTASGPYTISNPHVNPATYLSGRGPITSPKCTGLEILRYEDPEQLWYYDGKYLRYQSVDGPYLAYENGQVVLSSSADKAFDDIYRYVDGNGTTYDAYIIHNSSITGNSNSLNQLGGVGYYAAGVYAVYMGSRWAFYQADPAREVTLSVTPATSTITLGKTTTLTPKVLLEGAATTDYTISWTSQNKAVATVSEGVITPVSQGTTVITATITKVGGRDTYVRLDLPLTVAKTTGTDNSAALEALRTSVWEPVTGELPADRITGPYLIANRGSDFIVTGTQGMTNAICTAGGLEMIPYVPGAQTNLWYYDGNGLLFGDPNATDRYLVYEDGQVGLGPDEGMNFNEIYHTTNYTPSYNIANGALTGHKYLNQLGGNSYNAASVWRTDGDNTSGSSWYLYTLSQEKEISFSVNASKTELLLNESATLTSSLTVDGQTLSSGSYTVTYQSSDETIVKVSNGVLLPQKDGSATITATLKNFSGSKPQTAVSVTLLVRVYGIRGYAVDTKSGTVMANDEGSTTVGATITITYSNGATHQVPVTVNHLQNTDGSAVSTATAGTFRNLKLTYGGEVICTDFALTVRDEIPAEGAVYADKSVEGVNFFSSRVARVDLKVSGVNGEQGTAAGTSAYVLDTLGTYFTMQTAVTGRITPNMEIVSYPLYALTDYQNGLCTLNQVGTRKGSAVAVEKVTFSTDGTKAYSNVIGSSTNILQSGVISGSNFWYNTNATASFVSYNGQTLSIPAKTLRWKVGTLSNTELVMSYYVVIDQGKAAGTYAVGRYTDVYYTDPASASQRISITSPTIYYEEGEEEIIIPTLNPAYASLSFEDEVLYNVYFTVTDQGSVTLADMGLITFDSKLTEGTIANCTGNYPGAVNQSGMFMVRSGGIPAKKLGDTLYFKIYAKLSDGTYVYSNILGYSARQYAKKQLEGTDTKLKQLVVSMVNYGAAAQYTFGYNTSNLLNNILTTEHRALVSSYNATMVPATAVDSTKTTNFANRVGFSKKYATVSFESAFALNYYFTPDSTPDGNVTMYYWSQGDYQKLSTLTTANATKRITMTKTASGEYTAEISGIAAKELGDAVYVAVVCTAGGQSYCSGVIGYSVGVYCKSFASDSTSDMFIIGKATIIYGYYAKNYFDSL